MKKIKEYFPSNSDPCITGKKVSDVVHTDDNNTIDDVPKSTRTEADNIKYLKDNSYPLPYTQLSQSWYKNASTKELSNTNSNVCINSLVNDNTTPATNKRKGEANTDDGQKRKKNEIYCDKPILFPSLSHKWYALQASEKKICFPRLSRKWFRKEYESRQKEIRSVFPNCDQSSCPKLGCSRSNEKPVEQVIEKNLNGQIPYQFLSRKWHKRRGKLMLKNRSRSKLVKAGGNLEQNIQALKETNKNFDPGTKRYSENKTMINAGTYILKNGPLVSTQELGVVLLGDKHDKSRKKQMPRSSELVRRLQTNLNVTYVKLRGKTYVMENRNQNISKIAKTLEDLIGRCSQEDLNTHLEAKIGTLLKSAVRFTDTKKDRDLIKGLFASATSIKFVAKMLDVKNRNSIRFAKDELGFKLSKFEEVENTSQVVRNDMTNEQQRRLTKRIIGQRKMNEFKLKHETRGRALLANIFTELKIVLEEIFNHGVNGMYGGLESHPRLTSDILYRSRDNTLFMHQARKILLQVSPPGFGISLKSCYNYTESYKDKTYAARRHHAGKGVNAKISLKRPPRTGVSKHVINLHWTTKNVNLLLENMETCSNDCVIDSKDAKAIVCGDIQPVQHPGKSWRPITYEDHTFDQSRTNAVYPMTHLFMEAPKTSVNEEAESVKVTRTGQAAVLINIAISEPETTFRAMNELLYLITRPHLDNIFRNSVTGKLKSVLCFIVDNGHGEDPDSPLTQMCMSRLLYLLSISKISQKSFAEYHSKRNFVERVHAAENLALSRHGPFNSKKIHKNPEIGSEEHLENMEQMASDVKDCLSQAQFAGRFLQCFRGINKNGVFDDEEKLKEFLSLSEERKEECTWAYRARSGSNPVFESLVMVWDVPENFERQYISDYNVVMNKGENCSAWKDKYSTTLYRSVDESNFKLQPIPDFVRWFESKGDLHYLSYERTAMLYEEIKIDVPALFLPSTILDWLFTKNSAPP